MTKSIKLALIALAVIAMLIPSSSFASVAPPREVVEQVDQSFTGPFDDIEPLIHESKGKISIKATSQEIIPTVDNITAIDIFLSCVDSVKSKQPVCTDVPITVHLALPSTDPKEKKAKEVLRCEGVRISQLVSLRDGIERVRFELGEPLPIIPGESFIVCVTQDALSKKGGSIVGWAYNTDLNSYPPADGGVDPRLHKIPVPVDFGFVTHYNSPEPPVIPDSADVADDVTVGGGTVLGEGVKIEQGSTIGQNVQIDDNAQIGQGVTIGDGTTIAQNVDIKENVQIGINVVIGLDSQIKPDAKIGDNVVIGQSTEIKDRAIVGDGTVIGDGVQIKEDATVGDNVQIGDGSEVKEGATIGDGAVLGNNVKVGQNAVIAPGATVPDGTEISNGGTFP